MAINLFGIVKFDGEALSPRRLDRVLRPYLERGHDGAEFWVESQAALACSSSRSAANASRVQQPLLSTGNNLVLTADARLDNRAELITILSAVGYLASKDPTDPEIILAAYQHWGEECPQQLLGDFAFAVWDRKAGVAFLARDPLGVRPLFYATVGSTLLWSSEIRPILSVWNRATQPDDTAVAAYLSGRLDLLAERTFYHEVHRLPAGTRMRAERGGQHLHRYWSVEVGSPIRFPTGDQYAARFRELFEQAVATRLQSPVPIGLLFSGGLDSSAILCVAEGLRRTDSAIPQLVPACLAFQEQGQADERRFQSLTLEHCQLDGQILDGDSHWALRDYGTDGFWQQVLEEPPLGTEALMDVAISHLHRLGTRTVLAGFGGDQALFDTYYYQPELIRQLPPWRWPRQLAYYRQYGLPWTHIVLGVGMALDQGLQLRRLWAGRHRRANKTLASPSLLQGTGVTTLAPTTPPTARPRTQDSMIRSLTSMAQTGYWLLSLDRLCRRKGMRVALPFLDLRLLSYLLSIPSEKLNSHGQTRVVMRQALVGILPEDVRTRADHAIFNEYFAIGLLDRERGTVEALLKDEARCVQRGYVDRTALNQLLRDTRERSANFSRVVTLNTAINLELWLRSLDARG